MSTSGVNAALGTAPKKGTRCRQRESVQETPVSVRCSASAAANSVAEGSVRRSTGLEKHGGHLDAEHLLRELQALLWHSGRVQIRCKQGSLCVLRGAASRCVLWGSAGTGLGV